MPLLDRNNKMDNLSSSGETSRTIGTLNGVGLSRSSGNSDPETEDDEVVQTYSVDKRHQLIQINDEASSNFSCSFKVQSVDKKPFELTVVEQSKLPPKNYRPAENGYIEGQFTSNTPKTYFLVLRAQQPCVCNVKIKLNRHDTSAGVAVGGSQRPENRVGSANPHHHIKTDQASEWFNLKYAVGAVILAAAVYGVLKYTRDRKKSDQSFDLRRTPSASADSYY